FLEGNIKENIFVQFLNYIETYEETNRSAHLLLMKAIAHEFLEQNYLAMESYLLLAEKSSADTALNCIHKAETIAKKQQDTCCYLDFLEKLNRSSLSVRNDLLDKKDAIRMFFEESLMKLSSFSGKEEKSICFICYDETEPNV